MIEFRRRPVLSLMASGAIHRVRVGSELARVSVVVTGRALFRGFRIVDCLCPAFLFIAYMALCADDFLMRSLKREICFGMIESRQLVPRSCIVATAATGRGAVREQSCHPLGKLASMRIFMAALAFLGGLVEEDGLRLGLFGRRVAFCA